MVCMFLLESKHFFILRQFMFALHLFSVFWVAPFHHSNALFCGLFFPFVYPGMSHARAFWTFYECLCEGFWNCGNNFFLAALWFSFLLWSLSWLLNKFEKKSFYIFLLLMKTVIEVESSILILIEIKLII